MIETKNEKDGHLTYTPEGNRKLNIAQIIKLEDVQETEYVTFPLHNVKVVEDKGTAKILDVEGFGLFVVFETDPVLIEEEQNIFNTPINPYPNSGNEYDW